MNYLNIRKLHYKTQRKIHLTLNASLDDWLFSPYHCLKTRFFIELSSLFVFFMQHTPIRPNFLTILYVISGIVGAVLLGSLEKNLIVVGVIVFFMCGILDWMDGLLARVTKKKSTLGNVLDAWAGDVVAFSFIIGLGMYVFNATQEIHFLYLMVIIIAIKALDLKDFCYRWLVYEFYKNSKLRNKKNKKKIKSNIDDQNFSKGLVFLKRFFQSFLDNRARTIDGIGLIILIELTYDKIILTNFIYYLFLLKILAIFVGGLYIVFFKDFAKKINSSFN